jgi:UDP-N-acetylmuramoylalanine--D-glutamate ligase
VARLLTKQNAPRRVSILGAGRSGLAAAKIFVELGSTVFVSDTCESQKLDFTLASNGLAQVAHEASEHSSRVLDCDVIILSPGIPSDIPILKQAHKAGIPVWSEMELGFRLSAAPYLAVTGSTGKSTTVSLLGAIMEAAGKPNVVAGNIGLPVSNAVGAIPAEGFIVAEVSSFQLENIDAFHPKVAAIVNLLKNHLDRYESEEAYYDAKKEIIRNMTRDDTLVLNANDDRLVAWAAEAGKRTNIMFYGRAMEGYDCAYHLDSTMYISRNGSVERLLDLSTMKLAGNHNYDNACCAAAMASVVKINSGAIAAGLCAFGGLPHRLEYVGEVKGVRFYNDSKATTAESMVCAVSAFSRNVHLIAGGRDKGCEFSLVSDALRRFARSVVLIGEAADRMQREWKGTTAISRAASLDEAVRQAFASAVPGDVVVLSPGCSSFDMFRDYEDRGQKFRDSVKALASQEGGSKNA